MNPDQTSLEAELRGLQVTPMDDDFLHRLEACADGTWTTPSPEELRFESVLRKTAAARLDSTFLADLEKIVHEVPFAMDEKIVLFPKANQATRQERAKRPMWAAAAAVALIGGVSALMMPVSRPPGTGGSGGFAKDQPVPKPNGAVVAQSPAALPQNYAPASFNRGVSEVHDEGMVWKSNRPHSLVRVVYKDKISVTDSEGRTYQVEHPREGYMLVPAQTD